MSYIWYSSECPNGHSYVIGDVSIQCDMFVCQLTLYIYILDAND